MVAHLSSLKASALGSETARSGTCLLRRMSAIRRAPVSELRLQLLPSDQLELSDCCLVRSVESVSDDGLSLHSRDDLKSAALRLNKPKI